MSQSISTLAYQAAAKLARGPYQAAILAGQARMSGADLRGKAARYSANYAASRKSLLARLSRAGIPHHVAVGPHGKLTLVLGIW